VLTQGILASHAKRGGRSRKPGPPVHDDLLAVVDKHGRPTHDFTADAPNQKWLTNITEHPTGEGTLYLCAVKDCCSNKIVGYSIDSRLKSSLAASAIRNAIALRSPVGTIVRCDRGTQFRSKTVVRLLKNNGLLGSMGRVGACGDNAAMESFFCLLQKNVLDTKRWETREELRLAIVVWIETKYNGRRRQRGLGKLTPVDFEMIYPAGSYTLTRLAGHYWHVRSLNMLSRRRRGLRTTHPECQPNRGQTLDHEGHGDSPAKEAVRLSAAKRPLHTAATRRQL